MTKNEGFSDKDKQELQDIRDHLDKIEVAVKNGDRFTFDLIVSLRKRVTALEEKLA